MWIIYQTTPLLTLDMSYFIIMNSCGSVTHPQPPSEGAPPDPPLCCLGGEM